MQHAPQRGVVGQSYVGESLIEARNRAAIHLIVLPVAAVHSDHGRFVTIGFGIRGRSTEGFSPIGGEAVDVLRMKTVAECMADYFVGHHPPVPGSGKPLQSVGAAHGLEDSTHASMLAIGPHARKGAAAQKSGGCPPVFRSRACWCRSWRVDPGEALSRIVRRQTTEMHQFFSRSGTAVAVALVWSACASRRIVVPLPAGGDGPTPSWVELQPGMELRVEGAYYREGAPRVGIADYLGAETARYEVTSGGALRMVSVQSFVTEQNGKTQPRDQPAVQTLVRPRNLTYRYHRLFFQVVMSRAGATRPALLLGAPSPAALDRVTQQFLAGQHSPCGARQSDQCTTFPEMITASVDVVITVNGAPRKVVWGTALDRVAGRTARKIELKRLANGRLTPVPIDPSDPDAMRTPLLHGDEITWE